MEIEVTLADIQAAQEWFTPRGINFEVIPEVELADRFARHRLAAIKERDAQIVAWLRDLAHESQRKAAAPIADAIERGEV